MPILQQTDGQVIAPDTGHGAFSGKTPVISQPQKVAPGVGHVTYHGYAPTVSITAGQIISPLKGVIQIAGKISTVVRTDNISIAPSSGHILLGGKSPAVSISTPGQCPSAEEIAAAVLVALQGAEIPVDVRRMNGAQVIGTGAEADPWRGVGVSP